jgi:hypothetical protein
MKAKYLGTPTTIKGLTMKEYKHQWYLANKAKKTQAAPVETKGLVKGMTRKEYQAAYRAANKAKIANYKVVTRQARTAAGLHTITGEPLKSIVGRIYLAQVEGQTGVKIGYSSEHPGTKLSKIQMYHTREVSMPYMGPEVQGVNFLENKLHDLFSNKHIRGEWYALTKTDMKKLRALVNKQKTVTHKTVL